MTRPIGLVAGSLRVHTGAQAGVERGAHRAIDTAGTLALAKRWGFGGVMLSAHRLDTRDPTALRKLRTEAEALGLFTELSLRAFHLDDLPSWIETAAHIGCPLVRVTAAPFENGERWKLVGNIRAVQRSMRAKLEAAAPAAARAGVQIAIENHMDYTLPEFEVLLAPLDPERFGVCLDTGNPLGTVEDPVRVCEALAPRTFTTHLKDYVPVWTPEGYRLVTVTLGNGMIDIPRIARALERAAPHANWCLEIPVFSVRTIPIFRPGFFEAYGHRSAPDLAAVARLIQRAPASIAADPRNSLERGLPENALLAEEARLFKDSLAFARSMIAAKEEART